jgi:hypothetical protein
MILFEIFILNLVFYSYSKIIFYILNIKNTDFFEKTLLGFFFISLITLYFHFFVPINNTISNLILVIGIIFLIFGYKELTPKLLLKNFLLSLFVLILVSYSDYQEDFPWYSIPYISYLNFDRISFGISNIQFRFGHISILQYASSFISGSSFLNKNLLLVPYASVNACFILFALNQIRKKKFDISLTFLSLTLVYSLIKFYKFSSYGNDIPGHILYFYVIYKFLQIIKSYDTFSIDQFLLSILASLFCLMQKSQLSLIIIFPIFLYFKKLKFFNGKKFLLLILLNCILIFPWFIKNTINTSCAIYPMPVTCLNNLQWSAQNDYDHGNAKKVYLESSAWSKGYPDQNKSNFLNYKDFQKNFNWIKTWTKVNAKVFMLKLVPILVSFTIILVLSKYKKWKFSQIEYNENSDFIFCLIFLTFSTLTWFLIFPTYRYGESVIISTLILLFILIFHKNINTKSINILILFSLIFFITNNFYRIYKNSNKSLLYEINRNYLQITKIYFNNSKNFYIEYSKDEACKYGAVICSHHGHILDKNIIGVIKNGYKFYIPE